MPGCKERNQLVIFHKMEMWVQLTATVAYTFSANTILWDSMTKKLMNCSTSSKRRSREAFGMVKYFLGRNWDVKPRPNASFPATSALAVATTAVSVCYGCMLRS